MNRTMAAQSPDCADGAWSRDGKEGGGAVVTHFQSLAITLINPKLYPMTMHPTCYIFAFVVSQISIHFHFDHSLSDKFCTVSSLTSSLHPLWVTAFILPGIWRWHSQPLSGCSRHHQLIRWYAVLSLGVTMSRRVTARSNKIAKM